MNRNQSRNSLIAKVKDKSVKEVQKERSKQKKDKTKVKHRFSNFIKNNLTTYSDKKSLRRFDMFLKISAGIFSLFFLVSFILIITSPHQFTRQLVYRKDDTLIYDKDNKLIGKISQKRENGENVLNVTYDQLSQGLINATVGTEDATFFNHNGVDFLSTLENGVKTTLHLGKGGGSTITQQIIGQSHLGRIGNDSKIRKIREIFLSLIGETQLSKTEIITSYLNYVEFGVGNVRGVELASKYFYNKSVSQIDYVQSAILSGTLNQPSAANPLGTPVDGGYVNNSQKRLETVLLSNYDRGYLSKSEYYLLQQVQVKNEVSFNKTTSSNPYQAYIDIVARELQEKYQVDPFIQTLKVYTTMDTKAQKYANELTNGKHVTRPDKYINFGFIVSKTQTGEIAAIGGGTQYQNNGAYLFNNAIDNKNQPGSAFKPIIDYSPTFEFLHWSDRTPISNAPYKYPNGDEVFNVDRTSGGVLTMDSAIASSRNLTALRAMDAVVEKIGYDGLTEYLNRFGFGFDNGELVPAYALGGLAHGVSPYQMNIAYQAFGNGGYYIEPYTIRSFINEDNKEVKKIDTKKQIIDEKTAFLTSTTLERSTNIRGAYISTANYYETPYAAKTGTSNWDKNSYGIPEMSPRDTWYSGYTSEYTMTCWGGYDTAAIKKGYYPDFYTGAHDYSAKLWGAMMKQMVNGKEKSYLSMELPVGLVEKYFDSSATPPFKLGSMSAYFYSDNIPSGYSEAYYKKQQEAAEKAKKEQEDAEKKKNSNSSSNNENNTSSGNGTDESGNSDNNNTTTTPPTTTTP